MLWAAPVVISTELSAHVLGNFELLQVELAWRHDEQQRPRAGVPVQAGMSREHGAVQKGSLVWS